MAAFQQNTESGGRKVGKDTPQSLTEFKAQKQVSSTHLHRAGQC